MTFSVEKVFFESAVNFDLRNSRGQTDTHTDIIAYYSPGPVSNELGEKLHLFVFLEALNCCDRVTNIYR